MLNFSYSIIQPATELVNGWMRLSIRQLVISTSQSVIRPCESLLDRLLVIQ